MRSIVAAIGLTALAGTAAAEDTHCWAKLDADQDRQITSAEVMAILTPEASESLKYLHLERDHDGGISTAELEAGKAKLSTSDAGIDVDGNGTMSAEEVAATIEAERLTAMIPPETRMDRWKKAPGKWMAGIKAKFEPEQSELVTMLLAEPGCKGHAAPLSTMVSAG